MERTIITHNIETGIAVILFDHNGVTLEQTYNLWDVIPGTRYIFNAMGIGELTEEMQNSAIETLTASVQRGIEDGMIVNPLVAEVPEYQAPPEPEEGGE